MAKIRRPKSNLILSTTTPPHSSLIHAQAHTHTYDSVWSLVQSKCSINVVSFQFHKYPDFFLSYNPFWTLFWIPRMFLLKHVYGSFLLFILFFFSSNKSSEKLSISTLSKANVPNRCYSPYSLLVYLQRQHLFNLLFYYF